MRSNMSQRSTNLTIKGIVFDVGDTLLETGPLKRAGVDYATSELYNKGMISNTQKLAKAFFEVDERTVFPHVSHFYSHTEIVVEALGISAVMQPTKFSLHTVACIFLSHYREKVKSQVYPSEDLSNLLNTLKQRKIKLGIISNGILQDQIDVLERLNVTTYFDSILVSEELDIEKPEPEIFMISVQQLGLSENNVLYVGDKWESDIYGALNAGLQAALSVQFRNTDLEKAQKEPKCSIIYRLEDILKLLD